MDIKELKNSWNEFAKIDLLWSILAAPVKKGQVAFLMHLARAVDCRSVIICGGHEHSFQSGYVCNENLESHIECAPCWRFNTFEYDRKCMDMIEVGDVLETVRRVLAKRGSPLETETVNL